LAKNIAVLKSEISVRGAWPPNGGQMGQMSQFIPQNFWGPPTPTSWRRNFGNIFRRHGVIRDLRKKM